jgi:hypothetical protein
MAKEPEARYPTAGEFVQALEAALDTNPTASTLRQPTASTRRLAPMPVPVPVPDPHRPAAQARAARPPASGPSRPAAGAVPRPTPGRERPHTGRTAALAALAVVLLGVILLISQLEGGSGTPRRAASPGAARSAAAARHRHSKRTPVQTSTTASSQSTTPAAASSQTGSASAPATGPAPATSASALQLQGHQELLAHSYPAAISTLHKALASASPSSLTYAYALYDLGVALLQSGNPQAAVPVLEQRLKIPNQTSVVRQMLDRALQASGQAPAAAPSAQASSSQTTTSATSASTAPAPAAPAPPKPAAKAKAPGHHGRPAKENKDLRSD